MNNIPEAVRKIADDVNAGRSRRAKVRTLFGYYNLHRRRDAGIAVVRSDLVAFGIETVPDFSIAGFDDQVRFVQIGAAAVLGDAPSESSAVEAFLILNEVSATAPRFRILMRTFDAFDRLKHEIVDRRLAAILASGQNARKEDRDRFPFFLQVELPVELSEAELQGWAEEAIAVGVSIDGPPADMDHAIEVPADTIDFDEVIRHTSDLQAALRTEIADQVRSLRSAIEKKVDEVRIESIRTLARELNNEEALKFIEEFDQDMKGRLAKKDEELNDANSHIIRLQSQVEDVEQSLDGGTSYDAEDAYPTLSATVQLFADLAQGSPVTVHPNAVKSAGRSACTRRREVMRFLLVLGELSDSLYRRDDLHKPLREWFEERGYDYAQGDSQTSSTKFGQEREIQHGEEKIQLSEHVTLFHNTPNCVSVYFFRDHAARRLLIGYVGTHLRTASR